MNIENIPVLTVIDDSHISHQGQRVGTINIADGPNIGGKWYAAVHPYGDDHPGKFPDHAEAVAIGKLFAAAPDMLQTLIDIRDEVDNLGTICAGSLSNDLYDKIINAITKATT